MPTFAEVVHGRVARVTESEHRPILGPPCLAVEVTNETGPADPGMTWTGQRFERDTPPPPIEPPRLTMAILSMTVSGPNSAKAKVDMLRREVTIALGDAIHAEGEVQMGGKRVPATDTFRMPIRRSDGTEPELALAAIREGALSVKWRPSAPGIYDITEATINRDLPPAKHLKLAQIRVYVIGGLE